MRLLIDTNRFIDFCKGDESVVDTFERAALLVIPFIVLAEISAGAQMTKRGDAQVRVLNSLLNEQGVRDVHSTRATAHHYGAIYAKLRRNGTPVPTNDIWIAALALEHGLILYTRNAHFQHIPSVPRLAGS